MEQIPLFINMEINTMHVRKKRPPSPEQLETEIPARQTQSRAVHLTPSKSHLLRTAADRHAAGVEQRDITCVILCRRFASYQDKMGNNVGVVIPTKIFSYVFSTTRRLLQFASSSKNVLYI